MLFEIVVIATLVSLGVGLIVWAITSSWWDSSMEKEKEKYKKLNERHGRVVAGNKLNIKEWNRKYSLKCQELSEAKKQIVINNSFSYEDDVKNRFENWTSIDIKYKDKDGISQVGYINDPESAIGLIKHLIYKD